MTTALAPELADLLGQTGHNWPDADENQLITMADGWKNLNEAVSSVRADHARSRQAIFASNRGEGISAFGDWADKFDTALLQLVELCARVEAILLDVARTVLAVKKAILDALETLANAIAKAKDGANDIPIIGGLISKAIEWIVEPIFTAVRNLITAVITTVSDLIVNLVVPILTDVVGLLKSLVQDLRKLIKDRPAGDWPTEPSGTANPEKKPRGKPATWEASDREETKRGRRMENEAAATLAQAGYDVEQLEEKRGRTKQKNPDYRIEGKIFDCASPRTGNAYSFWKRMKEDKVEAGQADRLIININGPETEMTLEALRTQFQGHPIPGLKEAKVIARGGAIIDIYP